MQTISNPCTNLGGKGILGWSVQGEYIMFLKFYEPLILHHTFCAHLDMLSTSATTAGNAHTPHHSAHNRISSDTGAHLTHAWGWFIRVGCMLKDPFIGLFDSPRGHFWQSNVTLYSTCLSFEFPPGAPSRSNGSGQSQSRAVSSSGAAPASFAAANSLGMVVARTVRTRTYKLEMLACCNIMHNLNAVLS